MPFPAVEPAAVVPMVVWPHDDTPVRGLIVTVGRVAVRRIVDRSGVAVTAVPVASISVTTVSIPPVSISAVADWNPDSDTNRQTGLGTRRCGKSEATDDHRDQEKFFPIHIFHLLSVNLLIEHKLRRRVSTYCSEEACSYVAFALMKISRPICS